MGPFEKGENFRGSTSQSASSSANSAGSTGLSNPNSNDEAIQQRIKNIKYWPSFENEYNNNKCFQNKINAAYSEQNKKIKRKLKKGKYINLGESNTKAASFMFSKQLEESQNLLKECIQQENAKAASTDRGQQTTSPDDVKAPSYEGSPFDRRLDRLLTFADSDKSAINIPFSSNYQYSATSGFFASEKFLRESNMTDKDSIIEASEKLQKAAQKDSINIGVPALMNNYAITKLYGSEGGKYLINKRGERRWYEVDELSNGSGSISGNAFSMNPTTSSLINWGGADPYGRTPYHFTDFVFAKYWKKIENNRLITLRRYAAPIYDNLKFPGMTANNTKDLSEFPPMATAITYFGEETENKLSSLLKFTTGVPWDDVKSDVWEVNTTATPDSEAGPPGIFGGISQMARVLNVAVGKNDHQLTMNKGNLPPDPYTGGPYENRIMGPVNRIDSVKKRKAGINFEWSGLSLVFEYVARPVGGVNPKAVLLDILSNFLVIGSASAVFFGGQHRFMADPGKYPFLGGDKGVEAWYNGKPLEWAGTAIKTFAGDVTDPTGNIAKGSKSFMDTLLGQGGKFSMEGLFGAVKGLFDPNGAAAKVAGNLIVDQIAGKSTGAVPYLQGLKALLTGEPVGEWHITVGNPLNPIAMIGNLVCTGLEVEFGDELGPDDFPTEIKFTVKLDHGMPRDRDAIQSIFNKGMGRIYDLADNFEGTADGQSKVDANTEQSKNSGSIALSKGWLAGPSTMGSKSGKAIVKTPSNNGEPSVWSPLEFRAVSPNENLLDEKGVLTARSQFSLVDWIALKTAK